MSLDKNRKFKLELRQKDVASIFGVTEDCITNWENDRSRPQIEHCRKIIEFLGYNPFPFDTSTVGGWIRKYRIENEISQEQLADMVGVNETVISTLDEPDLCFWLFERLSPRW